YHEYYPLSLLDALPISSLQSRLRLKQVNHQSDLLPVTGREWIRRRSRILQPGGSDRPDECKQHLRGRHAERDVSLFQRWWPDIRSEEHTSELQSLAYLV